MLELMNKMIILILSLLGYSRAYQALIIHFSVQTQDVNRK
jgi:hypothetical protein